MPGLCCCVDWGLLCSCKTRTPGVWASVVAEHGLHNCSPQARDETGSVAVAHRLSCSTRGGIFPDQGLNLCLLHWWQVLDHWATRDAPRSILTAVTSSGVHSGVRTQQTAHLKLACGFKTSLVVQMVKASAYNAGDPGLIPGSGISPGEGSGNQLQYSCLENPMDGGAWRATIHGVAESQI